MSVYLSLNDVCRTRAETFEACELLIVDFIQIGNSRENAGIVKSFDSSKTEFHNLEFFSPLGNSSGELALAEVIRASKLFVIVGNDQFGAADRANGRHVPIVKASEGSYVHFLLHFMS
jgi:hypothetical protein